MPSGDEKAAEKPIGEEEKEKMLMRETEEKEKEGKTNTGTEDTDPEAAERPEKAAEAEKETRQQNGGTKFLDQEGIERYRRNPLWKGLRFALYGSLICLFLSLLVAATLIVVLSPGCDPNVEGQHNGAEVGALKATETNREGKLMREAKQIGSIVPLAFPALLSVPEGESAFFYCEFLGGKVRWNRIGPSEELQPVEELEQYKNGTLKIGKTKLSHQGEYVCEGLGTEDGQWHGSEKVKLVVQEEGEAEQEQEQIGRTTAPTEGPDQSLSPSLPSKVFPTGGPRPRVDTYLKLASAGEPVHFRCWMAGKSSDDLQWHKLIEGGRREGERQAGEGISLLAAEPDGHSAFLIFGAVKMSDAGEYECVDRRTGVASSLVRLRIEPARSPIVHPMEQSVPEGSPAEIRCSVPGHPDAQLIWRRENGVEVSTVEGVSEDGRGTLRIAETRREHERMGWVCWAIYTQRADKQALSGGPAVIRVIRREQEEGTAEGETEESGGKGGASKGEIEGQGEEEKQSEAEKQEEEEKRSGSEAEKEADQEENSPTEAEIDQTTTESYTEQTTGEDQHPAEENEADHDQSPTHTEREADQSSTIIDADQTPTEDKGDQKAEIDQNPTETTGEDQHSLSAAENEADQSPIDQSPTEAIYQHPSEAENDQKQTEEGPKVPEGNQNSTPALESTQNTEGKAEGPSSTAE